MQRHLRASKLTPTWLGLGTPCLGYPKRCPSLPQFPLNFLGRLLITDATKGFSLYLYVAVSREVLGITYIAVVP